MADTPQHSPTPEKAQPKIVHKLAVRTLLAVVLLAGLFFGLRAWQEYSKDPTRFGYANTQGAVAAIEYLDNGQQAVVLLPDGKVLRSPDYQPGNTERDLAWSPSGNHLYYVSDREQGTFQLFRWRPAEGGESEARTIGSRGKSNPTFAAGENPGDQILMTSGGVVLELDPVNKKTRQILPPLGNEIQTSTEEEGGGGTSPFGAVYGRLGESFYRARYLPGKDQVLAVMRRDAGEVLVLQDLRLKNDKVQPPVPLAAGDKIEFDIAPNGTVVYSVLNFQWPLEPPQEFVKNGRITTPFEHMIGMVKVGEPPQPPIAISDKNEAAFGQVAVSPDGSRVLVQMGFYDGTNFESRGVAIMPVQSNGAASGSPLLQGEIYEPGWAPGGKQIVYVRRGDGKRSVYVANDDGSSERRLGGESNGDFGRPVFSPQVAKNP